ncbi:MAG: AAA family ATPase [Candidatus Methylomirabilia bacterium]
MKPLRLEMQAFGPFRGKETVDFEKLSSSLFLITGPIGAGKTTVLDALCFALYGESSGKGRAAGDLRSHHADATQETEVTLDFSVGGKTYRVKRRPIQEIRKKRGEGTRLVQARGTLWDLTGKGRAPEEGTPLAGNVREVDERIREILGFDAAQFRQVILLPQGKFREFLSANSKDREAILKVLFDVRRCEELERELKDAVQELENSSQGREAARREKLGTFASREDLEQGVRDRAGEVAALEAQRRDLAARDARAEAALAQGRRVDGLFAGLAQAEGVRAGLAAQADAMDAVRDELALAERARPVLPVIAALDVLRVEIAVMERDLGLKERERASTRPHVRTMTGGCRNTRPGNPATRGTSPRSAGSRICAPR